MTDHTRPVSPAAIPTRYNGTEFRSRLEARWAAFFDLIGWQWEYEPIDLPGWIPDFILTGATTVLVEIKPAETLDGFDLHKINEARRAGNDTHETLLLGRKPLLHGDYCRIVGWHTGHELGCADREEWDGDGYEACANEAVFLTSGTHIDYCSNTMSYQGRLTGFYDGNAYLTGNHYQDIEQAWDQAGNVTRWNRPKALR